MCSNPADASDRRRTARTIGFGELSIGGIAVALENAPPARKTPFDASDGAAVFEAVDDWWSGGPAQNGGTLGAPAMVRDGADLICASRRQRKS